MRKATVHLFVTLILSLLCINVIAQDSTVSDYLDASRSQEESGNIEVALETLFQARSDVKTPSLEIAVNYLRLTAHHRLSKHYRMAYAMYVWGLSAKEVASNKIALIAEIERLKPIAGNQRYDEWKQMLDDNNPEIYSSILSFWDNINILPSENYNPRLLEHWRRIGFARENYATEDMPPYNTDKRGFYHVKYGEPNRKIDLDTAINPSDVLSLTRNYYLQSQPNSNLRFNSGNNNFTTNLNIYEGNGKVHIWIYDNEEANQDLNLALYFHEKQNGTIEQLIVIDDLISSSWFSNNDPSSKGDLLQMIYYNRLKQYPEFGHIFNLMAFDKFSGIPGELTMTSGRAFKFRNRAKALHELKNAPVLASTDRKAVIDIPMNIRQYRVLDEDNNPAYITYVYNKPVQALRFDLIQNTDNFDKSNKSRFIEAESEYLVNYSLRNSLHLRNSDGKLLSRSYNNPVLILDDQDDDVPSLSVFEIPYVGEEAEQVFYAELFNRDKNSNPAFDLTLPNNLRGLGEVRMPQKNHFDVRPGKLLASDLILGFKKNSDLLENGPLPFIAATNDTLPAGEPLVVHFELYQLGLDSNGISRFEIEYKFSSVKGIFNLFGRSTGDINSIIEFEHDSKQFSESLEIESASLEPGNYNLDINITDNITGQKVNRSTQFTIVDDSDFYLSSTDE